MSGIGPIVPAETHMPVEGHSPTERDGGKAPRRPPKRPNEDDLVETEPHTLDFEA